MASTGVVALELIVDLCGSAQLLFEEVSSYKGRWTEHSVEVLYLLRDVDEGCSFVKLLLYKLVAENVAELFCCAGLACAGIEERSGLLFHISTYIVPLLGKLLFLKVDLVRYFLI